MSREELEKRILEARYNLTSTKDKETIDILEELAIKALVQEPLTEEDYIELNDRFGDYVVFVVRDMVSGKDERWIEGVRYADSN